MTRAASSASPASRVFPDGAVAPSVNSTRSPTRRPNSRMRTSVSPFSDSDALPPGRSTSTVPCTIAPEASKVHRSPSGTMTETGSTSWLARRTWFESCCSGVGDEFCIAGAMVTLAGTCWACSTCAAQTSAPDARSSAPDAEQRTGRTEQRTGRTERRAGRADSPRARHGMSTVMMIVTIRDVAVKAGSAAGVTMSGRFRASAASAVTRARGDRAAIAGAASRDETSFKRAPACRNAGSRRTASCIHAWQPGNRRRSRRAHRGCRRAARRCCASRGGPRGRVRRA